MNTNSPNDKLIAFLCYPLWPVGVLVLLLDSMKTNGYLRVHALQGIVLAAVLWVLTTVIGAISGGLLSLLVGPASFVLSLYYGYLAYQERTVEIPVLSDFMRGQRWI
jgi:uncharacterized membrane protein